MKLRLGWFGVVVAVSACSGNKVAIGNDALEVDGGGAGGGSGSGGTGTEGGGGSGNASGSAGSSGGSGICSLPADSGPCFADMTRWAFDPALGSCQPFTYGGCQGNANNFTSAAECAAQCGGGDACGLPIVSGPCDAYMPSWGFDPASGRCKSFVYGGCQGNANRFPTAAACAAQCGGGDVCAPQNAEGVGNCLLARGFKWDGTQCALVGGCTCEGPDCNNLIPTLEECVNAHAECPGAAPCVLERIAFQSFIGDNKACGTDDDCQVAQGGCGVSEDGCTNAVYVNKSTDMQKLDALRATLGTCLAEECSSGCDRAVPPAQCIDGSCWRARSAP